MIQHGVDEICFLALKENLFHLKRKRKEKKKNMFFDATGVLQGHSIHHTRRTWFSVGSMEFDQVKVCVHYT